MCLKAGLWEDKIRLSLSYFLAHSALTPHRIILTGGTLLSDTFNESPQINPDNYSKSKEHLIKPAPMGCHEWKQCVLLMYCTHTRQALFRKRSQGRFGSPPACFL